MGMNHPRSHSVSSLEATSTGGSLPGATVGNAAGSFWSDPDSRYLAWSLQKYGSHENQQRHRTCCAQHTT
jgi:hypothetical protein